VSVTVQNAGDRWIVEANGYLVGQANSQEAAELIAAVWREPQKWVASWRFAPA
jgi:hypothetical protein